MDRQESSEIELYLTLCITTMHGSAEKAIFNVCVQLGHKLPNHLPGLIALQKLLQDPLWVSAELMEWLFPRAHEIP